MRKERREGGQGGTSGRQSITRVEIGGGGHGRAGRGIDSTDGYFVWASPSSISTRSTTHVKWRNPSRDPSHTNRYRDLIMISNTSSVSLQSRGSVQSSIAYTRYCYSHPLTRRLCHISKDHSIKRDPQLLQRYRFEVVDVNRS